MPTVDMESARCPRPKVDEAVSTRTESSTAPRFNSGSPMPIDHVREALVGLGHRDCGADLIDDLGSREVAPEA